MADQHSEPDREKRVWSGTSIDGLLGYLDKAEKRRYSSVITILTLMLEMQSQEKRQTALDIEQKKLLLYRELNKYRFIPDLSPLTAGRRWILEWHVTRAGRRHAFSRSETNSLQLILSYATAGQLHRFRKCSNCSRWLYARFRHQVFCSTKCQQQQYGKSEKWKLHRRNYMRKYRRDTM